MPQLLKRMPGPVDPAAGLLRAEHFQLAYATTDMDQACDLLGRRLGIREFAKLGGPMPEGGTIDARFAWVGTVMYELLYAEGPGSDIYMARLRATPGFAMRQHHLGFLVHEPAQWHAAVAAAEALGYAVPWRSSNPLVEACFVDVPELGNFLEYLLPTQIGLDFFASVPRT